MGAKRSKKSTENINQKLQLVCKSGKYTLGYKSVLRSIRTGDAKMVLIASNCPPLVRCELEYYAWLGKAIVKQFNGNNMDLAIACGKYFRATTMAVLEAGDSDILRSA